MQSFQLTSLILHQPWVIVVLFLSLVLIRTIFNIIYNLYFHPLSSYPGPGFAAASYVPQFFARGRGDIRYVKTLHDKYGSVVRIAPNELSFTNPQAWRGQYYST